MGGPVAPADNKAEADGDGGGNTTELWRGPCVGVIAGFRGEFDSPVAPALPPASDAPSGIWTVRRGLAPPILPNLALFERDGGVNVVSGTTGAAELRPLSNDPEDLPRGGELPGPLRDPLPTSTDCDLFIPCSPAL